MNKIKDKLTLIIENADYVKPACKYCQSYKNGGCSFGCMNEQLKLTSPNYSCDNFNGVYEFNETTLGNIKDMLKLVEKLDKEMKNLELLLDGKINENDFNDMID